MQGGGHGREGLRGSFRGHEGAQGGGRGCGREGVGGGGGGPIIELTTPPVTDSSRRTLPVYKSFLFSKLLLLQELLSLIQSSEEWIYVVKHNRYTDKKIIDAYSSIARWGKHRFDIYSTITDCASISSSVNVNKSKVSMLSKYYNKVKFNVLSIFCQSNCLVVDVGSLDKF